MKMKRMWINQPSKLQAHHNLHGTRVLATEESVVCQCCRGEIHYDRELQQYTPCPVCHDPAKPGTPFGDMVEANNRMCQDCGNVGTPVDLDDCKYCGTRILLPWEIRNQSKSQIRRV